MQKAKEKFIFTPNERGALSLIRRGYCHSRAEISRRLQISRPTASLLIEKLIHIGAVHEIGLGKAARGKAPVLLAPNAEFQYSIGLDLGYSHQLVGVLVDGQDQIVKQETMEFDNTSLDSIREKSLEMFASLSRNHTICGLGLSLTGIVNAAEGKVLRSANPVFASYPIRDLFTQWTNLPIWISNRSRVEAYSESIGGAVNLQGDFILCSLGESLDAAFFINNKIILGPNRAAGEIRHIRLDDGRTLAEALVPEAILHASEDDLVAICAEGLFQLTQLLDLKTIVLSGRFTEFGPGFLPKLTQALSREQECQVSFSHYGKFSAARGSAMTVAETILSKEDVI